jgi:transcriptional regulator with XRE-family HTH domain
MLAVGKRIREVRKRRGLTVRRLGHELGLAGNQVGNLESGRSMLTVDLLEEIAAVLAVPVATLFAPPGAPVPWRRRPISDRASTAPRP